MTDRSKLAVGIDKAFKVKPPRMHKPDAELAIPDNFIGIEMECEGAPGINRSATTGLDRNVPEYWKRVEDGSLRNRGAEYITEVPLFGDAIREALRSFEQFYHKNSLVSSFRTSTHIHVDFSQPRDTLHLVQDFLMGYYLLEEAFFGFDSPLRADCGYCYMFSVAENELLNLLKAKNDAEFRAYANSTSRYYGCNPQALAKFGTIEFRHLSLVTDPATVLRWINLILRLKKFMLDNCSAKLNALEAIEAVGFDAFSAEVIGPELKLNDYINKDVVLKRFKMLKMIYSRPLSSGLSQDRLGKMIKGALDNPLFQKYQEQNKLPKPAKKAAAKKKEVPPPRQTVNTSFDAQIAEMLTATRGGATLNWVRPQRLDEAEIRPTEPERMEARRVWQTPGGDTVTFGAGTGLSAAQTEAMATARARVEAWNVLNGNNRVTVQGPVPPEVFSEPEDDDDPPVDWTE